MQQNMSKLVVPLWYLPTFHGDIRLEADGEAKTVLFVNEVTPTEIEALKLLRERAIKPNVLQTAWAAEADFPALDKEFYRTGKEQSVALKAPIAKVQELLARWLKPDRALVSAVRFSNGKVEETWASKDAPAPEVAPGSPYRDPAKKPEEAAVPAPAEAKKEDPKKDEPKPVVAATVAAPVQGCPAPNFPIADIRANRVLEAFLNEQQKADWRRKGQFVAIGHDTGHRYMVTTRERKDRLAKFGWRTLYDLEERRAMCVHDWDVPAAEEMLALKLFLELPGREHYLRAIPADEHLGG